MERGGGANAVDPKLREGPLHAGDRFGPRRLMDDQLADQRIVVRRDGVSTVDMGIEADAEPARHNEPFDPAG